MDNKEGNIGQRKSLSGHSIGVVARRTGLKPDVIRAWERRYGAISPSRTNTNRRLYSDQEVERLVLLHQATLAGRQIGQVCNLPTEELRRVVSADQEAISRAPRALRPTATEDQPAGSSHLAACLAAVENLDPQALVYHLDSAAIQLSPQQLIEKVFVPLLEMIGSLWEEGLLRVPHEHMASSVITGFLNNIRSSTAVSDNAPTILVATPARQLHEIGALMVAAIAASEGWRVTYLGSSLPSDELAAATGQRPVKVVALSIVYPTDDPHLERELRRLRHLLGDQVRIVCGGRSATAYSNTLTGIDAQIVDSLGSFRSILRQIRS